MKVKEKSVYLICLAVLDGIPIRPAESTKLQRILNRRLPELFRNRNAKKFCSVALNLAESGVFQSLWHANARFPELFNNSYECIGSNITQHPLILPFMLQHRVLVEAQQILEASLFNFVKQKCNGVLLEAIFPESIELPEWRPIFGKAGGKLPLDEAAQQALSPLMKKACQMRHIAVHRRVIPAKEVIDAVRNSASIVRILEDRPAMRRLYQIEKVLRSVHMQFQGVSQELEHSFQTQMETIMMRRYELDTQERMLKSRLIKEASESEKFIGESMVRVLATRSRSNSI
jgi:hypothetical protein